ncbi:MAG: hypothetical protein K0R13_3247 [Propionibacteriaceae bacterium]|jgi:hypothetical protein|nr:hypothetical protein [Propionibacteriaceae bacterium]MDF2746824.1 hypothetical protein [Propionibacteriaceae bacterium]
MMDAAPAARFTEQFKELIESGYGLALHDETIGQPIATQRVPKDKLRLDGVALRSLSGSA